VYSESVGYSLTPVFQNQRRFPLSVHMSPTIRSHDSRSRQSRRAPLSTDRAVGVTQVAQFAFTRQVLNKCLKLKNTCTLNYFSICSKARNFHWFLCYTSETAFFQCSLLRGQGPKQKCPVSAAPKYQYQKMSPCRFSHHFHT
jgi:hypothetical protein